MSIFHAVPPSVPAGPFISDITSSRALIRWTLTNQTLDEGPDRLTLTVNYANNTQVRQYSLLADTVEMLVQSITPGMEYLVTVSASNQDGTRTTDPAQFQTLPGRKHVGFLVRGGCVQCHILFFSCFLHGWLYFNAQYDSSYIKNSCRTSRR